MTSCFYMWAGKFRHVCRHHAACLASASCVSRWRKVNVSFDWGEHFVQSYSAQGFLLDPSVSWRMYLSKYVIPGQSCYSWGHMPREQKREAGVTEMFRETLTDRGFCTAGCFAFPRKTQKRRWNRKWLERLIMFHMFLKWLHWGRWDRSGQSSDIDESQKNDVFSLQAVLERISRRSFQTVSLNC